MVLPAIGAAGRPPLSEELARCAAIDDSAARLECFDGLATAATRADEAYAAPEPGEEEGAPDTGRVDATIDDLDRRPYGEYVFYLSNGQTWTEIEPGRARYRKGMAVRIDRTPLGGYVLSTDGGRATRVRLVE